MRLYRLDEGSLEEGQISGALRLGTSGFQYDHWKGVFYPEDLPKKHWFEFYARRFDTVEINNTFYRLPEPHTFEAWRKEAPEGFCYALKFSRYGTHMKRLKEPGRTVGRFMQRARRLGGLLGPLLVQLPPHFKADPARLASFLDAAPSGRRWTLEFRHGSWLSGEVLAILEERGAALCIHDMLPDHPWETTADWTYLRFHGDRYRGGYSPQKLTAAARRLAGLLDAGLDVYVYFNNDLEGHAVKDADNLRRYIARARG
jgi:uncharacterized protein YecE (DUF72 family)